MLTVSGSIALSKQKGFVGCRGSRCVFPALWMPVRHLAWSGHQCIRSPEKRGRLAGGEDAAAVAEKHAVVLGLKAYVLCVPYDVPQWLPRVLMALVQASTQPAPIKSTVRSACSSAWQKTPGCHLLGRSLEAVVPSLCKIHEQSSELFVCSSFEMPGIFQPAVMPQLLTRVYFSEILGGPEL